MLRSAAAAIFVFSFFIQFVPSPAMAGAREAEIWCVGYPEANEEFRRACGQFMNVHPGADVDPRPDTFPRVIVTCPAGFQVAMPYKRTVSCGLGPGTNSVARHLSQADADCLRYRQLNTACVVTGYKFCDAPNGDCVIDKIPCHFEKGVMACGAETDAISPSTELSEPVDADSLPADVAGDNCASYKDYNPAFFSKCTEFMAKHPGGVVVVPEGKKAQLQISCPPSMGVGTSDGEKCRMGPASRRVGTHLTPQDIECIKAPGLTKACFVRGYLHCDAGSSKCVNDTIPCMYDKDKLQCLDEKFRIIEE